MQDTGQGTNKAQQQHDQSQSDNQGRQGTRCLSQPCLLGAVSDGGDLSGTGCCGPLFGVRFGGVGRKTPQRRVGKAALRRIKKRFALALAFAWAVPHFLQTLPGWLIPGRWSDFSFWPDKEAFCFYF